MTDSTNQNLDYENYQVNSELSLQWYCNSRAEKSTKLVGIIFEERKVWDISNHFLSQLNVEWSNMNAILINSLNKSSQENIKASEGGG